MLDATNRLRAIGEQDSPGSENTSQDGNFATFVAKVRQLQRLVAILMLLGAFLGCSAGLIYVALKVPAFSASSQILISNTTLQLSGQDAVVTQILVENSLVENAIELLKSGKVLGRVVDKIGLEEVDRISPRSPGLPWSASEPESDANGRQAAIALLRANTTVKRVGSSQIVSVRARALTALDAARLSNEIAVAFVQEQYDANAVVTTSAALRERIKVLGPTARIISEAVPPKSKDTRGTTIAVLLGVMLGGLLAGAGSLAFIGFDRRVRATEQLAALTSVECFGYVPLMCRRPSPPEPDLSSSADPDEAPGANGGPQFGALSNLHAAFDKDRLPAQLRSLLKNPACQCHPALLGRFLNNPACQKLLAPDTDAELEVIVSRPMLRRIRASVQERSTKIPYIIGVTSCQAAEGKTTLATSLARFVARDSGPVLLVDACLPEFASRCEQDRAPGLLELLRGTAALEDVLIDNIYPNIDFLPNGNGDCDLEPMWRNLAPAISGRQERCYEWVILDLPPLTRAVDVRAASQAFQDLLIVVEWGRTSEGQFQQGLRALGSRRESVIGTLINKAPFPSSDSGT
jgi:Mrp family chromosome partitioning ATPase/capsular polysaccharide biosynthesis protein